MPLTQKERAQLRGWEKAIMEFPLALPSANRFMRLHWAARKKAIDESGLVVRATAKYHNYPAWDRVRHIEAVVRCKTRRRRDPMNYITPLDKLIVDPLVAMGIFPDDSELPVPQVCWEYGRGEGVVIIVTGRRKKDGKERKKIKKF